VSGNSAFGGADAVTDSGKGIAGAVFNFNGAFTAVASTFANNTADHYASQIFNLAYDGHTARVAQTTLRDTIVADGSGPANDLATDTSSYITPQNKSSDEADVSHFDLVRTMSATIVAGENGTITGPVLLTADPLLGPLQDNGGPTMTMAPASGSPVIDAAAAGACPTTDQRGRPRPDNRESACDIGAYEVQDQPSGTTGGGGSSPTATGGGTSRLPVITKETLSPAAFVAAPRGPSAQAAATRRYGTVVSFSLSEPATVRFTVVQLQPGRSGPRGRCVSATKSNRRARKCTRRVTLPGSFSRAGTAGANRFRFTGRLAGHALKPGRYQLVATPSSGGKAGRSSSAAFRVIR
jgi:hypothetical protein